MNCYFYIKLPNGGEVKIPTVFKKIGKDQKFQNLVQDYYIFKSSGQLTNKDGKDDKENILPGGVYFIQMIAGKYQKTIKTIFLK
jgi:hypothetical protein